MRPRRTKRQRDLDEKKAAKETAIATKAADVAAETNQEETPKTKKTKTEKEEKKASPNPKAAQAKAGRKKFRAAAAANASGGISDKEGEKSEDQVAAAASESSGGSHDSAQMSERKSKSKSGKRYSSEAAKGDIGVAHVALVCAQLNQLWVPRTAADVGIDGRIEIVDRKTGVALDGEINVQVKYRPNGYCQLERRDYDYWRTRQSPVIVIFVSPTDGSTSCRSRYFTMDDLKKQFDSVAHKETQTHAFQIKDGKPFEPTDAVFKELLDLAKTWKNNFVAVEGATFVEAYGRAQFILDTAFERLGRALTAGMARLTAKRHGNDFDETESEPESDVKDDYHAFPMMALCGHELLESVSLSTTSYEEIVRNLRIPTQSQLDLLRPYFEKLCSSRDLPNPKDNDSETAVSNIADDGYDGVVDHILQYCFRYPSPATKLAAELSKIVPQTDGTFLVGACEYDDVPPSVLLLLMELAIRFEPAAITNVKVVKFLSLLHAHAKTSSAAAAASASNVYG